MLREDVESGAIDVLWCYDPDRLGRDPALAQAVASLTDKNGVDLYVASGDYKLNSGNTPQRFMFSMQSTQGGVEQAKRKYRHKFGMESRIKNGLPNATWPYGYRPVRDRSGEVIGGEFDPSEIGAMHLATRLFLQGVGYKSITKVLNESQWKPRRGDYWRDGNVWKLMRNAFFAGYVHRNNVVNEEPSDKYPLLWDAETWGAIQAEHRRRKRGGKGPASCVSGVAYCARCETVMIVAGRYTDGAVRFVCHTHKRSWIGTPTCHPNTTKEDIIIEVVEALLEELRKTPGLIEKMVMAALPEEQELRATVEESTTELEKLYEQQKRLGLAVATGTISTAVARAADEELTGKVRAVEATRIQAEHKLAGLPDLETRCQQVREALKFVRLRDYDHLKVRAALMRAGIKVMVDAGEVVDVRIG
jgi:site-specific DNA recombinase